jgi:redox-sensitive bicupin YhaK (pirin superfamily)
MSHHAADDPVPGDAFACGAIETVIIPRARDLGGFEVRRALPSARKQMVGPFIFWDQMGPAEFLLGQGIDVRPHPHIGLATVTYLFDGEVMHRDSLGTEIPIRPGAMNLMSAGRGIVHSERTSPEARSVGAKLYGIQAWVALPRSHEEGDPAFTHYGAESLPVLGDRGVRLRLIAGEALGARSGVRTHSPLFYMHCQLAAGARAQLPAQHPERAAYVASGSIEVDGRAFGTGQLIVFRPGGSVLFTAVTPAVVMLLGGEPVGERFIEWNFVSSSKERIEQAKSDWRAGRMKLPDLDSGEFIPLPE